MTAKNSKYGSQHLTVTFSFKLSKFSATSMKDFLSVFIKGSYFVNDFKLSIADFFILFYYISNPFLKTFLFFPFAFPLCVCVCLSVSVSRSSETPASMWLGSCRLWRASSGRSTRGLRAWRRGCAISWTQVPQAQLHWKNCFGKLSVRAAAHTRTHSPQMQSHANVNMYGCIHAHTHTRTPTHTRTHTHTHAHTHPSAWSFLNVCEGIFAQEFACVLF